jgi:hypothetical protein
METPCSHYGSNSWDEYCHRYFGLERPSGRQVHTIPTANPDTPEVNPSLMGTLPRENWRVERNCAGSGRRTRGRAPSG